MEHLIRQELKGVVVFVGTIWAVFIADLIVPLDFTAWGLVPRTLHGLSGIPLAPFLHVNLAHLVSNTLPLVILLMLLAGSRTRTWATVVELVIAGGGLLWLFGRPAVHVGASVLIYGLIAFLIVAGVREKRLVPMAIALLVGFFYGGTLLWGILPSIHSNVSWDGHLFGALAGGVVGYFSVAARPTSEQPVR